MATGCCVTSPQVPVATVYRNSIIWLHVAKVIVFFVSKATTARGWNDDGNIWLHWQVWNVLMYLGYVTHLVSLLGRIFAIVRPRRLLYMAIDGVVNIYQLLTRDIWRTVLSVRLHVPRWTNRDPVVSVLQKNIGKPFGDYIGSFCVDLCMWREKQVAVARIRAELTEKGTILLVSITWLQVVSDQVFEMHQPVGHLPWVGVWRRLVRWRIC